MSNQPASRPDPAPPMRDVDEAVIAAAIRAHAHRPGALLPVLHAIQDRLGYVPPAGVAAIARGLGLSRAEIHGVLGFYHDFRSTPPGRRVVRICMAEACLSMGAERLREHARAALGIDFHQTTADGAVTLEPVYCLGNCACSPAVMVGRALHGRVSAARFDAIVAAPDAAGDAVADAAPGAARP